MHFLKKVFIKNVQKSLFMMTKTKEKEILVSYFDLIWRRTYPIYTHQCSTRPGWTIATNIEIYFEIKSLVLIFEPIINLYIIVMAKRGWTGQWAIRTEPTEHESHIKPHWPMAALTSKSAVPGKIEV